MKVSEIMKVLDAELIYGEEFLDRDVISACGSDMMSDVLAYVKEQAVLLTGLVNPQVVRTAEMMDMKCIVFVRGKKPDESMIELAKENGFDIFGTTLTVSPHKNAEVINAIGLAIQSQRQIEYLVSNFKKQNGYKLSVDLAKENGLYRQNYCGCEFALKIQQIEAPESLTKKY